MNMAKDHDELYGMVCKDRFDAIDEKQDRILNLLTGTNGSTGLCERVRSNTRVVKAILGGMVFVLVLVAKDVYVWIKTLL